MPHVDAHAGERTIDLSKVTDKATLFKELKNDGNIFAEKMAKINADAALSKTKVMPA